MSLQRYLPELGEHTPDIYHDVVTRDDYRLDSVAKGLPVAFLDVGASRGLYSLSARLRFPEAPILAIEPDPENFALLQQHAARFPLQVLQAALAPAGAPLYSRVGENSSVHSYQVLSRWKPPEVLEAEGYTPCDAATIALAEAAARLPAERLVIKIDIEGAEWLLMDDPAAEAVLRGAMQLHMELHYGCNEHLGVTGEQFATWADKFRGTHEVEISPLAEYAAMLHLTRRESA